MKLKITQEGVRANGKPLDVGALVEVNGDTVPASLVGKSIVVDTDTAETDGGNERAELKKQAAELGIEFAKNISTDKLKELVDAKLAA